jgi:hypothetical protein
MFWGSSLIVFVVKWPEWQQDSRVLLPIDLLLEKKPAE